MRQSWHGYGFNARLRESRRELSRVEQESADDRDDEANCDAMEKLTYEVEETAHGLVFVNWWIH